MITFKNGYWKLPVLSAVLVLVVPIPDSSSSPDSDSMCWTRVRESRSFLTKFFLDNYYCTPGVCRVGFSTRRLGIPDFPIRLFPTKLPEPTIFSSEPYPDPTRFYPEKNSRLPTFESGRESNPTSKMMGTIASASD